MSAVRPSRHGLPIRLALLLCGPLVVVTAWHLTYQYLGSSGEKTLLPSPLQTFRALWLFVASGEVLPHAGATLCRMATGFGIATLLGVLSGLAVGRISVLFDSVNPVVNFFRSTPVTTLYPAFVLAFGMGDLSKTAMIFWACFFVILFNTAGGTRQAGLVRTQMARLYGASGFQVFRWITLYESLPQTLLGLRLALSYALIVAVLCEMFMGANYGLGQKITDAHTGYALERLYAIILLTGTLGYVLNAAFERGEDYLVRWKER